jgi:hypothetical protein
MPVAPSEHSVRVRRLFGHVLDDIPVLNDFSIFQSEEVGQRTTGLTWIEYQM